MPVAHSDIYQDLFGQILDINPESQRLREICKVFLEQNFEQKDELLQLAFHKNKNDSSQTFESSLPEPIKGNHPSDDHAISNMSNLRDFPKLLKKQFLIPDEIFYHRLIRHDLFVMKKEERQPQMSWNEHLDQQSQLNTQKAHLRKRSYILMDVSASTAIANRLTIEKAIAISFLENHRVEEGEVWFRSFNQNCSHPWLAKDGISYRRLINKGIVTSIPVGQTNLEKALLTAFHDLDSQPSEHRAEILVLTDGLAPLNLSRLEGDLKNHKVHIVLIGGEKGEFSESELRDRFMDSHSSLKDEMENSPIKEHREKARSKLHQMYQQKRSHLQEELTNQWKNDLKSCSEMSGGLFLQIPDLPASAFSVDTQIQDLLERLVQLEKILNNPSTTSLEKEKIIDEVLAIRAYSQELKSNNTKLDQIDDLLTATANITLGSEELQAMLEHAQIRWRASISKGGEDLDFLLFFKVIKESLRRWVRGKEKP